MKKTAHIINVSILLLLATLSVLMIFTEVKTPSLADGENMLVWMSILFLMVMVLVMTITGVIFPEKDIYLNKKQSFIAKIILNLNMFFNKSVISSSQMELANGNRPIHRGFEPAVGVIWLFFQAIFSVPTIFMTSNSKMASMQICALTLIVLFIFVSYIWKIEDNKLRYGKPMIKKSLLPTLIVVVIFAIGAVGGYIKTKMDSKNDLNLSQIVKDIEKAKEIANKDYSDIEINLEDYLNDEDVITLIRNSMDTDEEIYYKLLSSSDGSNTITFVVWTNIDENVYWYKFISYDEGYIYHSAMKSNAMTKADVEGKQDGILSLN